MITCPVFEKMLSSESVFVSESIEYEGKMLREIQIPDVSPEAMREFLYYLYSEEQVVGLAGTFDKNKVSLALNLLYVGKCASPPPKSHFSQEIPSQKARELLHFLPHRLY